MTGQQGDLMAPTAAVLAMAILNRGIALLGLDPSLVAEQISYSEESAGGSDLSDLAVDSMNLAELLVTLEDDLDVSLFDLDELGSATSLVDLAELLLEHCSPSVLTKFCDRWERP